MTKLLYRSVLTLLALTCIAATSAITAAPAHADHLWPAIANEDEPIEENLGVRVSAPDTSGMYCIDDDWWVDSDAIACWEDYGDVWYVKDNRADGHSAAAVWEINSCNDSGTQCDYLYRQGICRNNQGAGTWVKCNKDYYEDMLVWFAGAEAEGWHIVDHGGWVTCPKQWPCHLTA